MERFEKPLQPDWKPKLVAGLAKWSGLDNGEGRRNTWALITVKYWAGDNKKEAGA